MGIMGLALAWETRIPAVAQRERRVEEAFREQDPAPGAAADRREDTALAAACLSGDLRAYERLYSLHGARMKNLARNILGSATDAEDACGKILAIAAVLSILSKAQQRAAPCNVSG